LVIRKHLSALVRAMAGLPAKRPNEKSRRIAMSVREAMRIVGRALGEKSRAPLDDFIGETDHTLSRIFATNLREFLIDRGFCATVMDSDCVVTTASGTFEFYWTALALPNQSQIAVPTVTKPSKRELELNVRTVLALARFWTVSPPLPDPVKGWVSLNLFSGDVCTMDASVLHAAPKEDIEEALVRLGLSYTGLESTIKGPIEIGDSPSLEI